MAYFPHLLTTVVSFVLFSEPQAPEKHIVKPDVTQLHALRRGREGGPSGSKKGARLSAPHDLVAGRGSQSCEVDPMQPMILRNSEGPTPVMTEQQDKPLNSRDYSRPVNSRSVSMPSADPSYTQVEPSPPVNFKEQKVAQVEAASHSTAQQAPQKLRLSPEAVNVPSPASIKKDAPIIIKNPPEKIDKGQLQPAKVKRVDVPEPEAQAFKKVHIVPPTPGVFETKGPTDRPAQKETVKPQTPQPGVEAQADEVVAAQVSESTDTMPPVGAGMPVPLVISAEIVAHDVTQASQIVQVTQVDLSAPPAQAFEIIDTVHSVVGENETAPFMDKAETAEIPVAAQVSKLTVGLQPELFSLKSEQSIREPIQRNRAVKTPEAAAANDRNPVTPKTTFEEPKLVRETQKVLGDTKLIESEPMETVIEEVVLVEPIQPLKEKEASSHDGGRFEEWDVKLKTTRVVLHSKPHTDNRLQHKFNKDVIHLYLEDSSIIHLPEMMNQLREAFLKLIQKSSKDEELIFDLSQLDLNLHKMAAGFITHHYLNAEIEGLYDHSLFDDWGTPSPLMKAPRSPSLFDMSGSPILSDKPKTARSLDFDEPGSPMLKGADFPALNLSPGSPMLKADESVSPILIPPGFDSPGSPMLKATTAVDKSASPMLIASDFPGFDLSPGSPMLKASDFPDLDLSPGSPLLKADPILKDIQESSNRTIKKAIPKQQLPKRSRRKRGDSENFPPNGEENFCN